MEQRRAERAKICRKLSICTDKSWDVHHLESALSRDLSTTGACVATHKHLEPGQKVFVRIPTDGCPSQWGLPPELQGTAEVKRVQKNEAGVRQVALHFETPLEHSMEFGFLMAYLLGRDPSTRSSFA